MSDLTGMGIGFGSDVAGYGFGIYDGDPLAAAAAGVPSPVNPFDALPGDASDSQQMAAWNPPLAKQQGAPWYAGIIGYGIVKAIDNQFPNSPSGMGGNTYPGSIAGVSGRSLSQRPTGAGGGVQAAVSGRLGAASISTNPTMLLLIGVAAFFLLRK